MNDDLNPAEAEDYLVTLLLPLTTRLLRDEALSMIEPGFFWSGHHSELWKAARHLRDTDKQITRRTLIAAADVGSTAAVERILDRVGGVVPSTKQFPAAVSEVIRCGKVRRIVEAMDRARQMALSAEDPSQALGAAFDALGKLDDAAGPSGPRSYAELLDKFEDAQTKARSNYLIVPTPWWALDEQISGGLHGGRLYIVGARPGEGKSIAAHNLAHHAAMNDHPALIFSVEMGDLEVTGRLVSHGADILMDRINRRQLLDTDWAEFKQYKANAAAFPLFVDDRADLTLAHIASTCRSQKRRTGLSVVVVDYLQLLKVDRSSASREQQVAHISRTLKQLSRELDVAVVVPAQLNRRAVDRDRPTLADLRESGGIEADADVVMLLSRLVFPQKSDQAGKPTGVLMVDIAKNRHGRIGPIDLQFRGEYSRIAN